MFSSLSLVFLQQQQSVFRLLFVRPKLPRKNPSDNYVVPSLVDLVGLRRKNPGGKCTTTLTDWRPHAKLAGTKPKFLL